MREFLKGFIATSIGAAITWWVCWSIMFSNQPKDSDLYRMGMERGVEIGIEVGIGECMKYMQQQQQQQPQPLKESNPWT